MAVPHIAKCKCVLVTWLDLSSKKLVAAWLGLEICDALRPLWRVVFPEYLHTHLLGLITSWSRWQMNRHLKGLDHGLRLKNLSRKESFSIGSIKLSIEAGFITKEPTKDSKRIEPNPMCLHLIYDGFIGVATSLVKCKPEHWNDGECELWSGRSWDPQARIIGSCSGIDLLEEFRSGKDFQGSDVASTRRFICVLPLSHKGHQPHFHFWQYSGSLWIWRRREVGN